MNLPDTEEFAGILELMDAIDYKPPNAERIAEWADGTSDPLRVAEALRKLASSIELVGRARGWAKVRYVEPQDVTE